MRKRAGLLLMLVGLMLASLAALLVLGMSQQAQQQATQQIRQVYVLTLVKDVPENTLISPEMLAVKPFPADFVPAGAVGSVEETTGKYSATKLYKDTILLSSQLTTTKLVRDLASNVPPGKVAFWLPMPDLLVSAGGLKQGDRVDVLLTVVIATSEDGRIGAGGQDGKFYSTQTTLQNVQVYAVGTVDQAIESGAQPASSSAASQINRAARTSNSNEKTAIVLLLDHQDAVILKWVKDVDGTVDVVLRSTDDSQVVRTDGMSNDTIIDRFKFRVPLQPASPAAARPQP
jgi:Flp pilus assembly protein CpaB